MQELRNGTRANSNLPRLIYNNVKEKKLIIMEQFKLNTIDEALEDFKKGKFVIKF